MPSRRSRPPRRAASAPAAYRHRTATPLRRRTDARRPKAKAAGDNGRSGLGLRWHDLRHTFASLLIAQGANVLHVSRMLGHASATITLDVYGRLFDRAEHGRKMRDGLEATFGNALETTGGEVVDLQRKGD